MTIEIKTLRVSADMDASAYAAGAAQKVAADKAMVASGQAVGATVSQTDAKISQAGDVLARLSRQYVDGYAAAQRFNSALNQLSNGIERGKISAEATGPILDGIYRKYGLMGDAAQFAARGQAQLATAITNANAKLAEQRNLTPVNQNQGGLARFGAMNAAAQFQDIAITAQMGQSPLTIALQQGTQLGQALQIEMGEQGVGGLVKGLAGAFRSLLSPVNLLAIGLTGVVAVAIQFGSKLIPQVKTLKEATDDQRKAVTDLAEAYGNAALKADDFYKKSVIASESEARRATEELKKSSGVASVGAFSDLVNPFAAGQGFITARDQFSAFNEPIQRIVREAHNGRPDFDAFEKSIAAVVEKNPGLETTADKILKIVAAATAAAAQLKNTSEAIKDINRASVGNFDRTQQAGREQSVMSQRFGDDPFAAQREQQRQKLIALTEAQDARNRSLDQTIASAKLDVELVGKTTAEIDGLRMAAQLEAQVREEAAKNNVKADEAEIARIKQKSAEYGRLKAQEEAASQIKSQQDDLELQRAEIGSVGQNKLAHDALIESLKTEQEIRKLGIDATGAQAEALRANTAAASANAEALARANMQADLMFERQQILRNETDATIAAAQHAAGLPVDLNSAEAGMMRYNMALQESKDTFKGFFSDMQSSLEQGRSLWESFGDAAKNALTKIADKFIDRGLDDIFNALAGGGQTGGGGLIGQLTGASGAANQNNPASGGGILSSLFGIGSSRAQSVASMQVQAAVVNINGGVGSIGSLLGGSGFQANTTLTDILTGGGGGGAANQNMIQSRIDQAFGTSSGGLGGIFTPAGGFASAVGGGGLTGSIGQYAAAIRSIESAGSGGYSALGPVLRNGNQALGAYQVMKSNLPSWSTEAFGSPMSASQFMNNPAAQDKIFEQQFGKLISKYGNPQDAASAWFTGGPLSSGAGKSDVLGTTGSKYVDMFNENLQKLGGTASSATSALNSLGGASQNLISSFSQMGQSLLSQLTPATSGSSWFQGLSGMFGGSSGALGFMNSISPAATSDILSGSWGLFDNGGWTGSGGRNQPAGIVHRGEIVWSQSDIARAGGAGVVEGMRRGVSGYAGGGYADRIRMRGTRHGGDTGGFVAANDGGHGRRNPYQGYDPTTPEAAGHSRVQNINNTNNFIFRDSPAAPSSQNQIAAKSAKALERLQRTA